MATKSLIHVSCDTNIIFTRSPEFFLNAQLSALIKQSVEFPTMDVRWYLPSVVQGERHQQILRAVPGLLENFRKLERWVEANYDLTEDQVRAAIAKRIERQITDHGITVVELDAKQVDWAEMIRRAVYREAPFEKSEEKEKGFRDAVILEVMCQIYDRFVRPKKGSQYFVACGDERFREAAEHRLGGTPGVTILPDFGNLQTRLNGLNAHLTIEVVEQLVSSASEFFASYFEAERIAERIYKQYSKELMTGRTPADTVTLQGSSIGETVFLNMGDSRPVFSTRIITFVEASRLVSSRTPPLFPTFPGEFSPRSRHPKPWGDVESESRRGFRPLSYRESQELFHMPMREPVEMRTTGSHSFNVIWSCIRGEGNRLEQFHLDGIIYDNMAWIEP